MIISNLDSAWQVGCDISNGWSIAKELEYKICGGHKPRSIWMIAIEYFAINLKGTTVIPLVLKSSEISIKLCTALRELLINVIMGTWIIGGVSLLETLLESQQARVINSTMDYCVHGTTK